MATTWLPLATREYLGKLLLEVTVKLKTSQSPPGNQLLLGKNYVLLVSGCWLLQDMQWV